MFRWDHTRDGYMLSHETYKNNMLYIKDNPKARYTKRSYRTCIWLWNNRKHTRTYLPPLYQQIFGATIWKNYIYVVARRKLKDRFYFLDMNSKNLIWQREHQLTKEVTSPYAFYPNLYNGNEYGVIVMYKDHFRFFHPERRTTQFRYFDSFFIGNWDMINVVTANNHLYCLRDDLLYNYDITSRQVVKHIFYNDLGGISQPMNCKGTCMHVYDNRFIMCIFERNMHYKGEYITYWAVAYYDCHKQGWVDDISKKYGMLNENANVDYPNGLCHYLWEDNSLCYMCCEVELQYGNDAYDSQFEYNIQKATTSQYHISYWLKNWDVIKVYILMRDLMDKKRATLKDSFQNTVVGYLMCIHQIDLFREVMTYLMCSDQHKYCLD